MKVLLMTAHDTAIPHCPVIIIGGGQAGLSVSWYLTRDGFDHIVFEQHRRFQSWRVNRWDSVFLSGHTELAMPTARLSLSERRPRRLRAQRRDRGLSRRVQRQL